MCRSPAWRRARALVADACMELALLESHAKVLRIRGGRSQLHACRGQPLSAGPRLPQQRKLKAGPQRCAAEAPCSSHSWPRAGAARRSESTARAWRRRASSWTAAAGAGATMRCTRCGPPPQRSRAARARACAHAGALAWPRGRSCARERRPGEAGAAPGAQKIVTAYETRAAELAREAAGLRAALDALQREHRRLLNQQARPPRACAWAQPRSRARPCRTQRGAGRTAAACGQATSRSRSVSERDTHMRWRSNTAGRRFWFNPSCRTFWLGLVNAGGTTQRTCPHARAAVYPHAALPKAR